MKLIDQSIRNYHTVMVVIVMALVVGVLCFQTLPRQLAPTVDKPEIEVKTEYLGLSPDEVERNITRRLEDQLESVEGMKKMTSTSQHGLSISTLFTLFLVPVLISLLIDMGFHTRKEDLVKDLLQAAPDSVPTAT